MFSLTLRTDAYPQRRDWQDLPWLDRIGEGLRVRLRARVALRAGRRLAVAAQVEAEEARLDALDDAARAAALTDLRRALRRDGFADDRLVAQAFATVRRESRRLLGKAHFGTQIQGAWVLLHGNIAEMNTGEGKSLTATLAAATAALAGMKVHIVTVNDYLAGRDRDEFGPLYAALGLACAFVGESATPEEKAAAYRADIVYCSNKTIVFDYLRDRLALADRMQPLRLALDGMLGAQRRHLLHGLQFAIVDEADSVFVDEARTPLIISAARQSVEAETFYREAIALAGQLVADADFTLDPQRHQVSLTEPGRLRLPALAAVVTASPVWRSALRTEEACVLALQALHAFRRDIHYIVRDDKVMIVDEHTGRVMPDRSWERGLQQLIEVKEGVAVSPEKETLGRISYQMFFRRYLRLSGMSGTCREVSGELADVYGLGVVRIPPHKPSRRLHLPARLFATSDARWQAVVESVVAHSRQGRPVLVGTRSIAASEDLSARLAAAGIAHQVLNAKQDEQEAALVASAGDAGQVTIATNMAGRGTDIKLGDAVRTAGGLHVILTELHDASRVDRQLAGRCARMGDPGSWEEILSLDDELVAGLFAPLRALLAARLAGGRPSGPWHALALRLYRRAQAQTEKRHAGIRGFLLRADFRSRTALSFTGEME